MFLGRASNPPFGLLGPMLRELNEGLIRSWRAGDEDSQVRFANNRRVSINLTDAFPYPYTTEDARAWLRLVSHEGPESNFAIASVEESTGAIGLRQGNGVFRRSAEFGCWLGEPFWGQGIATGAVQALTRCAFTRYHLARIEARVYEDNPASAGSWKRPGTFVKAGCA